MVVVFNNEADNNAECEPILTDYAVLFDNEHDSDCTFIVGQTDGDTWRFPGHTQILGKHNVRLREMFRNMPPSKIIHINDVDKRGFEYLLRCLYRQEINFLKVETALNALKTGFKYQCVSLVEKSVKYIDSCLNNANVLDILIEIGLPTQNIREGDSDLAQIERFYHQLRHNCLVLIDREASKVLENERFEDLSREQVEFILQRDSLQPTREYDCWRALERWLDRECKRLQLENTNSMKRKILGHTERVVRYSLMKKRELLAGPTRILTSAESDEIFRQIKNKERNLRNGQIEQPFPLNSSSKKQRKNSNSSHNSTKVVANRVYDFCLTCLVCIFD